jgi:hypothetical protein
MPMRVNKSGKSKLNYVQTKNQKYPIHENPSRIHTDGKSKKVKQTKENDVYHSDAWLEYEKYFNEKYKEPKTFLGKVGYFIDRSANELFYIGVFLAFSAILLSGMI